MSQKPASEKLKIKPGYRVMLIDEPLGYRENMVLPEGVEIITGKGKEVDLAQLFVTDMKGLKDKLPKLKKMMKKSGLIWVTYPKGTSKLAKEGNVDINRDSIWKYGDEIGLTGVSMISIDDTWSGFRMKIN
jgi:galactokinase